MAALKARLKNVRSQKRLSRVNIQPDDKSCPNCTELTLVINLKNLHTQITKPIGEGSYSFVYEGSWESHHGLVSLLASSHGSFSLRPIWETQLSYY